MFQDISLGLCSSRGGKTDGVDWCAYSSAMNRPVVRTAVLEPEEGTPQWYSSDTLCQAGARGGYAADTHPTRSTELEPEEGTPQWYSSDTVCRAGAGRGYAAVIFIRHGMPSWSPGRVCRSDTHRHGLPSWSRKRVCRSDTHPTRYAELEPEEGFVLYVH